MTVATKTEPRGRNKMETSIGPRPDATTDANIKTEDTICAMPAMKCPACGNNLDEPAAACPVCKFALRRLDTKFGTVPLHSRYLTDRASSLTRREANRLGKLLRRFEKKFPQSIFSVFVTDLPAETNISEFTFWLFNRAQFGSVEAVGEYNFDLLLVVEAETGNAALTVGYGLEELISEDDLNVALTAALPALRAAQLERGIRLCVEEMTRQLTDICKALADASKARVGRVAGEIW